MAIDAHQHFWKFDAARDGWINDDMAILKRDFLPADLEPHLAENNMDGCILVQSHQAADANEFMLGLAFANDFIKGVIGWIDLSANDISAQLNYWSHFKKLKGFRHILQSETDRAYMLQPAFQKGIAALMQHGYTYDLLILPDQLGFAKQLVANFPGQTFILDHLAKPLIKKQEIKTWQKDISDLAGLPNVYCKISGMVTEADWQHWQAGDFKPYLDAVVNAFGTGRLLFGSDWPVCLLAASYKQVVALARNYFSSFSPAEQEQIFGGNAEKIYQLNAYYGSAIKG